MCCVDTGEGRLAAPLTILLTGNACIVLSHGL
jgi:hypothetical protein